MLVLSRKPGEAIRIGEDIEVSIIEVRGDTVRIGIDAPRNVPIFRTELIAEVAKTNIESVKAATKTVDVLKHILSGEAGKDDKNGGIQK